MSHRSDSFVNDCRYSFRASCCFSFKRNTSSPMSFNPWFQRAFEQLVVRHSAIRACAVQPDTTIRVVRNWIMPEPLITSGMRVRHPRVVCHTTAVYTPELHSIFRLLMATYHSGLYRFWTRLSWFLHRQHFLQKVMRQKCLSSPIQCVAGRLSDVADILQKYRLCIPNDASLVQLGAQVGNSPKIWSTSPSQWEEPRRHLSWECTEGWHPTGAFSNFRFARILYVIFVGASSLVGKGISETQAFHKPGQSECQGQNLTRGAKCSSWLAHRNNGWHNASRGSSPRPSLSPSLSRSQLLAADSEEPLAFWVPDTQLRPATMDEQQ